MFTFASIKKNILLISRKKTLCNMTLLNTMIQMARLNYSALMSLQCSDTVFFQRTVPALSFGV